jgi:hypothetical protein
MAFLQSDIHINRPLTDMVLKFDPSTIGFARNRVFRRKPVDKLSNQIRSIAREQMLRLQNMKTGEQGRVGRVQFATGPTQTYTCEVFALEAMLDNIEQQNADAELQYQLNQQEAPLLAMQLGLEKLAIEDTLRDTTKLTQNVTLNTSQQWNNKGGGSSNPFLDILTGVKIVASQAQRKANLVLIDHMVWAELITHPAVQKLVNFWSNGSIITTSILEKMLEDWLEPGSIIIYRARYNAQQDGSGAEVFHSPLGADVVIAYVDNPGMMSWGLGYEFAWNGLAGDTPAIVLQFPTYESPLGGNIIRTVTAVEYHVANAKSGYLIKAAVDSTQAQFNGEL